MVSFGVISKVSLLRIYQGTERFSAKVRMTDISNIFNRLFAFFISDLADLVI